MRRFLSILVLVLSVTMAAQAESRVAQFTLKSELLGVEKVYSVYLPDGYDNSTERYPVLYLLHGAFGTHLSWVNEKGGDVRVIADRAISSGRAKKMIIVMPDARGVEENKAGRNMGFFNVDGWPYEEFFFKEFIPHIDKSFRTIATKDGRAIAGLSMGGGGAVVYAQHHPEIFNASYSTSGLLDDGYSALKASKSFHPSWLWSVTQTSPVKYLQNASQSQLSKLRTVRWMLDCGDDDGILLTNLDFVAEMKREKVAVEFRVRNGNHNWSFWRESLPLILNFSFK